MLALYRSGRQAEALSVFQAGRTRFAEELGLEPGPQLVELQRKILDHDPTLAAPAASATDEAPRRGRRRRRLALAGAAASVLALGASLGIVFAPGGGGEAEPISGDVRTGRARYAFRSSLGEGLVDQEPGRGRNRLRLALARRP